MKFLAAVSLVTLLLAGGSVRAANNGTIAVLNGALVVHSFAGGDFPAAETHAIVREKVIFDTVNGNYTVFQFSTIAGKHYYHIAAEGTLTPSTLPVDAQGRNNVSFYVTSTTTVTAEDDVSNDDHSFVQILGLNNALRSRQAGLAKSFPAALNFFATSSSKDVKITGKVTTLTTTTGVLTLNIALTRQNSAGNSYGDAITALKSALAEAHYTEK